MVPNSPVHLQKFDVVQFKNVAYILCGTSYLLRYLLRYLSSPQYAMSQAAHGHWPDLLA